MNLYEMMRQAQGGEAFASLARQYGLTQDEVRRAVEAFTPAFSTALQRNTADPMGFFQFMQALASGQHAQFYRSPEEAAAPAGRREGEAILDRLFGSRELSRAVADQISAATGLADAVVSEMMPALSAMMMGGLEQQVGSGHNPMLEEMTRRMSALSGAAPAAGSETAQDTDPKRREQGSPFPGASAGSPFEAMFQTLYGAGLGSGEPGGRARAPRREPEPGAPRAGSDVFGELFEPGRKISEAYQRRIETLFDQFARPPRGS
jgi:hypothetical protein